MLNSVYRINKGINQPVVFKGLKAQYIWYLGGAMVALLIVFAILYIIGLNPFCCVAIALVTGTVLVVWIYQLSNKYGEHGLTKKLTKKSIPHVVRGRYPLFKNESASVLKD